MTTTTSGGADTHRAAVEALDHVLDGVRARDRALSDAEAELTARIRAAKATPGVTAQQIADVLGVDRRTVYKRLAQRA